MNCAEQLPHVIRQGDNLYHLAKHYQTTVSSIFSMNPDIDPYNLQVGTTIFICPGEGFSRPDGGAGRPPCPDHTKQTALINNMRLVWSQHVYWTRMLLLSIAERLRDQNDVTNRILQNPYDIANIYRSFYTSDIADQIAQLLTEHLKIGAALITALRDGKAAEAKKLNEQWYINADKMAGAFSKINPYYKYEEVKDMLYRHLRLTTQEVAMRLAKNYPADIEAFDIVEREALMMADYFASGIIRQFPQKFD